MATKTSAALRVIFGADTTQLDKALGGVSRRLQQTGKKLKGIGRGMSLGITAPLTAIGVSSFRVATEFEASMARVAAVAKASSSEFKQLRDSALELGRTTTFTASQVANLQEAYARLGFSTKQILDAQEATLYLAQATGSDLASAAEVAGATVRGFGLAATDTAHVTDVMAASFSASALDLESFRESMKYVAPVAQAAGISIEETTAMLAALANNGIKGSQAGTALRRIISQLGGTGANVADEIERLAQGGLNLADAKDEVGRSAQTALLVLSKTGDVTKSLTEDFTNADGAAKGMADIMNDTAAGALARMQSAIEGAQIEIGTKLAPTILRVVEYISDLATRFAELDEGTQDTIITMAAVAAAIGPILIGVGSLTSGIGALIPAIKALYGFLLANPWVAIATAIAAVAVAVYNLWDNTKKLTGVQKAQAEIAERAAKATAQERVEVEKLVRIATSENVQRATRLDAIKKLNAISPEYLGNLTEENILTAEGKRALENYNKELLKRARIRAQEERLVELEKEIIDIEARKREINKQLRETQKEGLLPGTISIQWSLLFDVLRQTNAELAGVVEERDYLLDELVAASTVPDPKPIPDPISTGGTGETAPTGGGEETVITPTVVVAPDYRMSEAEEELQNVLLQLSQEEAEIAGTFALTGDEAERADALAEAYTRAAISAATLGELDIAQDLYAQAQAHTTVAEEVDATTQVMNTLNDRLRQASDLGQVFGDSFDVTGTKIQAIQSAIQDLIALGIDPASEAIQELKRRLDELNSPTTTQAFIDLEDAARTVGQNMGRAFQHIADTHRDLTQQVEEGSISQAEATEKAAEASRAAIRAAALQTIGALLAETLATAIKNAFQSASATGPAAAFIGPALAATAAAGVTALFSSKIPAFAEGGMVTGGPTLALLGDNPSGREAVIPFEKMGQFMKMVGAEGGTQRVEVFGKIRGRDILLTNERNQYEKTRTRGF